MAISENALMAGASGALNKQVVFRQFNGKTVISAYPNMGERTLSPKQVEINELMKKANLQVKAILADDQQRNTAQIRLNVPRNKLYDALIREYFKKARQTPDHTR